MNKIVTLLSLFFTFGTIAQNNLILTNPDFISSTNGWTGVGQISLSHNNAGSLTTGSAQLDVLSTNGNVWNAQLQSNYFTIPNNQKNELLYLSIHSKSLFNKEFRVQIQTQDNLGNTNNSNSVYFTTDTSFQYFYLPVIFNDNDTSFRIRLQCGLDTGTIFFDDVSLILDPFDVSNVEQNNHWVARNFIAPALSNSQTLNAGSADINVLINAQDTIAPVFPTHFGVNSNIRSSNSLVSRSDLYNEFGSFRFPAGSGSNRYFWDCNIPSSTSIPINPLCGTDSSFLNIPNFLQFKQNAQGEATVVVNYFYARYGVTSSGTREDRVVQAAAYAAAFVRELNINHNANIKYWEIGNECYGSWEEGYDVNGSILTGKEYGEDLRVFADSMRAVDSTILIGAVLSHNDFYWNGQVLTEVENDADFLILHHYFDDVQSGEDAQFAVKEIKMDMEAAQKMVEKYTSKPAGYFPITYTEFNNRGDHETTISNGLFIADALGSIIENRFSLATIWVNEWNISGFQSKGLLAVNDVDQQDYTARPSYTPFYYYDKCFGDQIIKSTVSGNNDQKIYASIFNSGEIGVVVINYSDTSKSINFETPGNIAFDTAYWYSVYADNKIIGNKKFYVNGVTSQTVGGGPENLDLVPANVAQLSDSTIITVPKLSANYFVLKPKEQNSTTSLHNEVSPQFKIYPNPTSETASIIGEIKNKKAIEVYNLLGQNITNQIIISAVNKSELQLNLRRIPSGTYLVKIENKTLRIIKK